VSRHRKAGNEPAEERLKAWKNSTPIALRCTEDRRSAADRKPRYLLGDSSPVALQ